MTRHTIFRILAALALAALLFVLGPYAGLWEVAALVLLGAGLGGVMARPKRAAGFRPTYWERREMETPRVELTVRNGE